jgi:hypothetical protein
MARMSTSFTHSEHFHRNQRCDGNQVQQRYPFQQGLVIEEADHEHQTYAAQDPIHLLEMYTHKLGAEGCAIDLEHAQRAN